MSIDWRQLKLTINQFPPWKIPFTRPPLISTAPWQVTTSSVLVESGLVMVLSFTDKIILFHRIHSIIIIQRPRPPQLTTTIIRTIHPNWYPKVAWIITKVRIVSLSTTCFPTLGPWADNSINSTLPGKPFWLPCWWPTQWDQLWSLYPGTMQSVYHIRVVVCYQTRSPFSFPLRNSFSGSGNTFNESRLWDDQHW